MKATNASTSTSTNDNNTPVEVQFIDMASDDSQATILKMPATPAWSAAAEIGYEPKTTFWYDFSIADRFGLEAVVDTYRRVVAAWRDDVEYMAELALVLNHKGWAYYHAAQEHDGDKALQALSNLYINMFRAVHEYCQDYFKGGDAEYYFNIVD